MALVEVSINYMAVVFAAVIYMAIGAFWYSPALFAGQWLEGMGKKASDIDRDKMGQVYGVTAIAALIQSFVLAHFVQYAGAVTLSDGMKVGAWVWLGFLATSGLVMTLFENKNKQVYYISAGYQLVGLIITGALLAIWM